MTSIVTQENMNPRNMADQAGRFAALVRLFERLDCYELEDSGVLPGSSPIPAFGSPSTPRLATVGINPSNREFLDADGRELCGPSRRFHTLSSLRLHSWSEVDARHLATIIETHDSYFTHNPYDRWFDRLDKVISGANVSYYDPDRSACHLDIVPFATAKKWSDLSTRQRAVLIEASAESLALTLRASTIGTVVLNGISVVRAFEALAGVRFDRDAVPSWTLRRRRTRDVTGIAYKGCVDAMAGVNLGRSIMVLGFNHNLQSSFGVSTEIVISIKDWIAASTEEMEC